MMATEFYDSGFEKTEQALEEYLQRPENKKKLLKFAIGQSICEYLSGLPRYEHIYDDDAPLQEETNSIMKQIDGIIDNIP